MKLTVASSPHIRGNFRTNRIMLDVVLALLPALAVGVAVQGWRALLVVLTSVITAMLAEYTYCLILRSRDTTLDRSCIVTGLLLGMTLPASVPIWLVILGNVFAIIVVKCLCGGLGQNIFNPALAGRAFMMLVYPVGMTRYASDRDLLGEGHTPLFGSVKVPGSAESLLHLRLAEAGLTTMGVAVHVPHYLAETQFGDAAVAAADALMDLTGLVLPTAELIAMAGVTRARIEAELAQSDGAREVVQGLEERYDHFVEGQRRRSLLAAEAAKLPSADEIGEALEKFLQDPDVAGPAPQEPSDEGSSDH